MFENKQNLQDMQLEQYDFFLPEKQIAQTPSDNRSGSRLLVLDKKKKQIRHDGVFEDILDYLPPKCLLIVNNSKVIPARMFGRRESGGKVEFLLLTPPPLFEIQQNKEQSDWYYAGADGLLRSSKKIQKNEKVFFGENCFLTLSERGEYGHCSVYLHWKGLFHEILQTYGTLPLPPYIRRKNLDVDSLEKNDRERYQTVYAREDKAGSVAAPTAGLHFTPEIKDKIIESGREWAEVTLYVGYGTFSPVRDEDIRNHAMHPEFVELPAKTVEAIKKAKADGRSIIAVGTTSARVLEGVYNALSPSIDEKQFSTYTNSNEDNNTTPLLEQNFCLKEYSGWINIFLYPGKQFHVIDGLITNFHLPRSTLLMLVSALLGRDTVLKAYTYAVSKEYRFFSYGDAMLII